MNFENQKIFTYTAIIFGLIAFFFIINVDENESWEKVIKNIENDEYNGIVTRKFIDKENHNTSIVVLNNGKKITFWKDWHLVNIGDSISKRKHTANLEIFKSSEIIKIDFRKEIEKRMPKNKKNNAIR